MMLSIAVPADSCSRANMAFNRAGSPGTGAPGGNGAASAGAVLSSRATGRRPGGGELWRSGICSAGLSGCEEWLGPVREVTVRSRGAPLEASLETIVDGNITLFESRCEKTCSRPYDGYAARREANAAIGVRYDSAELAQGVTEVIACKTAVQGGTGIIR
jgi:uncharacterized protein YbjQ (UPF0145 family)